MLQAGDDKGVDRIPHPPTIPRGRLGRYRMRHRLKRPMFSGVRLGGAGFRPDGTLINPILQDRNRRRRQGLPFFRHPGQIRMPASDHLDQQRLSGLPWNEGRPMFAALQRLSAAVEAETVLGPGRAMALGAGAGEHRLDVPDKVDRCRRGDSTDGCSPPKQRRKRESEKGG